MTDYNVLNPATLYHAKDQDNGMSWGHKPKGMLTLEDWPLSEIRLLRTEQEVQSALLHGHRIERFEE